MKRFVKRALLTIGLFALVTAFAVPTAEAGRRHRSRVVSHGAGYSATYRGHHGHHVYRGVSRVRVHVAPVVVAPIVPVISIPHYGYHHGPSVYFHGYVR